jgi:glycosyltransferase involved in cell wall biosynthesis
MKKILIVNNNLDMGGIQKSLINLLTELNGKYDITLLLFSKSGALLQDLPKNVKVITPNGCYRMLGLTKNELKKYPFLFLLKAFLVKYTALSSRRSAMKILGLFQKKIRGYDAVISYSHLFHHKYFGNGCGEFVLDKTVCDKKICLIHCDYVNSGCLSELNNASYTEFDQIACCSDSVKARFLEGSGIDPEKASTLRNFFDLSVTESAKKEPYTYDDRFINLVSVARLSKEKGIDRAIDALYQSGRTDIRYHVVGNGPQKSILENKIQAYGMENRVFLLGEQHNPYRYMIGADYLLVPSLNEAAPMVFDEAILLGTKVITTNTTSADEMIGCEHGIVCENSTDGIVRTLMSIGKSAKSVTGDFDNEKQRMQLDLVLGQ